jgi:phenylacetic acid degradation operon negative regulatory protein
MVNYMKGKFGKEIKNISFGVLDTAIDASLFVLFFSLLGSSKAALYKGPLELASDAAEAVFRIRGKKLKKALSYAKHNGLVDYSKKFLKITEAGKKRLFALLPSYDEERAWEGKIYLITYDIPETRKKDRDILREYLRKIGCGMLQASVWLTPYNPKGVLREFLQERKLYGWVIISDVGRDGSIGGKDIKELVTEVYNLEKINKQYRDFLKRVEEKKERQEILSLLFLSILMDDPQLPFELLPDDWEGERSYKVYKNLYKELERD